MQLLLMSLCPLPLPSLLGINLELKEKDAGRGGETPFRYLAVLSCSETRLGRGKGHNGDHVPHR